ncbi:uncharacterized protein LOC114343904 [Diabrotica virgifera virgifera]|uniref:Uncharacterized protein LOC114343904 isoform X2 n=1 Tax=Diabrotica virgifera virgifera TaxID=50390 RepID=A0A6P7H3G3_DIAVI|nr:uncharacterized protein LOC114343904 [Diabrotica virgifera virgifera]
METSSTKKTSKSGDVSLLKKLFDIRRPAKVQNATFPRTTGKSSEEEPTGKERLFVRNQSYRKKSLKNKYKKQNSEVNNVDSNEHEHGANVKKLCQQFEQTEIKSAEDKSDTLADSSRADDKILKQSISNVEVKRRNSGINYKQKRENKIKSFVEAENEDATEEYRKSLISQMDMEIAHMREDGFIDDEDNFMTDAPHTVLDETSPLFSEVNSDYLVSNKNLEEPMNLDPDINTFCTDITTVAENELSDFHDDAKCHQDILRLNSYEEFTESLGDDLENGLFVVEAYNDDGRELIEVQVMIDRRPVSMDKEGLTDAIKDSEMVFYENVDRTYNCIRNELTEYIDQNKSEQCAGASRNLEENIYENIETPSEETKEPLMMFAPMSNRSTIYSVTSQESSVFDTDDEGIELGRNKEVYSSVRRETFCDDKGIVRIERVAFSDNHPFPSFVTRSESTASLKRLEYIIDEIKSTERKYVEDLAKVVKTYKPWIERHTPVELKDYHGYLFGNIDKIHRRQRKFLEDLNKCGRDVNEVVGCFIKHELLFEMYPHYFRNKPKADNLLKEFSPIIKEMQEKYGERLDFSAYLLTPVQRLGKYILLLEQIEKQLKKLELPVDNTQTALAIVREEMSKGNDSVAIESIENSPISKMDYGSFKMREMFSITKPRKVECMVFLFTNVLVFTTCDPTRLEVFYYYDHIKMNDLRIATFNDFIIHLTDFTKSKKKQNSSKYTYILEAKSEKIWRTWKEMIEKILWDQLRKTKETLMSDKIPKTINVRDRNRTKSTGSSVFYCE